MRSPSHAVLRLEFCASISHASGLEIETQDAHPFAFFSTMVTFTTASSFSNSPLKKKRPVCSRCRPCNLAARSRVPIVRSIRGILLARNALPHEYDHREVRKWCLIEVEKSLPTEPRNESKSVSEKTDIAVESAPSWYPILIRRIGPKGIGLSTSTSVHCQKGA